MGSEVKMASLSKPPDSAAQLLLHDRLFPFDDKTQQEKRRESGAPAIAAARSNLVLEEGLSDFSLLCTAWLDGDELADDGIGLISADDYVRPVDEPT